jgi:hypothetical protein
MLILRSRLLCPKTQDPSALEVTSSLKLQLFKRYVYPCFCQLPSRPAGRRATARRRRRGRIPQTKATVEFLCTGSGGRLGAIKDNRYVPDQSQRQT